MPKEFYVHSLFLVSAVALTYFWTSNPNLSLYNLQFIGLFVLLYFLSHFLSRSAPATSAVDAIIFTVVILLLVASTGGLNSPLFFLIYFLLFAVALLFEPLVTLTLAGAVTLFFWPNPLTPSALIQLFSVLLILPLSIFLGRQYLKVLAAKDEIKILTKSITTEETDSLLWLCLNFKEGLIKIVHLTADLLTGLGQLTIMQKESLQKINQTAKELLKTGDKLKDKIDKETD